MHPDLSKAERAIVFRALHNHAKACETEAKKLDGLGYPKMASQLSGEASHINDNLKTLFSDEVQTEIAAPKGQLDMTKPEDVPPSRPHLVKDEPDGEKCEACDRVSADVAPRAEWDNAKLCETCVATMGNQESAPPALAVWPDPGDIPPHSVPATDQGSPE